MSTLSEHKLHYEDLTPKKTAKRGGKAKKMAKNNKEIPAAKTRKVYQKTRGEHYKDILIAILITGIVAFIAGLQFANSNNAAIQAATEAIAPAASAEVKK